MIGALNILRLLGNPIAAYGLGFAVAVGGYNAGLWIGHARGEADQKAAQAEADAAAQVEIRERVRDALDQIGASASDADVDVILRELAGE